MPPGGPESRTARRVIIRNSRAERRAVGGPTRSMSIDHREAPEARPCRRGRRLVRDGRSRPIGRLRQCTTTSSVSGLRPRPRQSAPAPCGLNSRWGRCKARQAIGPRAALGPVVEIVVRGITMPSRSALTSPVGPRGDSDYRTIVRFLLRSEAGVDARSRRHPQLVNNRAPTPPQSTRRNPPPRLAIPTCSGGAGPTNHNIL